LITTFPHINLKTDKGGISIKTL